MSLIPIETKMIEIINDKIIKLGNCCCEEALWINGILWKNTITDEIFRLSRINENEWQINVQQQSFGCDEHFLTRYCDCDPEDCYDNSYFLHESEKATKETIIKLVEYLKTYKTFKRCISCNSIVTKLNENKCTHCIFSEFMLELPTCSICLEYISLKPGIKISICENEHYIHRTCCNKMVDKKCPICRGFKFD